MAKPTVRELVESMQNAHDSSWADVLASRVEKVLVLHKRVDAPEPWCEHCLGDDTHDPDGRFVPWPCPTVRILNGEEA